VSDAVRWLLPLPVVLPLLGAGATMVLGRWRAAQRAVSIAVLGGSAAASAGLLAVVERDGVATVQAGGWPAPLGITLVADLMAALLLLVGLVTVLLVLLFAIGQPGTEQRFASFHPVYLVLAAGVSLSFLTGDLFNLFVAFELMLVASYVLITLGGTRQQVRAGMTYVVINLLASTLFVTAVAFIYGATGTVNMADLAGKIGELDPGLRSAFALLLLVVFGIKAAIFPLFFWLPDSYPTASTPVTAVFAGLLTKVGVYTILRTQTLLFPESSRPATAILVLASLTMVIGVLGAIAQDDVKRILSFHIVSQIGYMIFGLGLFTVVGVAGAILFVVHQIPVKTALFMAGGLIEHAGGHSKLSRIGGLLHRTPVIAVLFLLPALSLAGIPPLSGFIGKLALVEAGLDAGAWWPTAASLGAGLLTLFSMTKIWGGSFWGQADEPVEGHVVRGRLGAPPLMVASTGGLVLVTLAVAALAGPIWSLCLRASSDLLDPSVYVQAVLGG
jgi:multicomponent Na+:H+ antiporter subunit D